NLTNMEALTLAAYFSGREYHDALCHVLRQHSQEPVIPREEMEKNDLVRLMNVPAGSLEELAEILHSAITTREMHAASAEGAAPITWLCNLEAMITQGLNQRSY